MKGLDIIFAVMALMAACGIAYTRHSLSTMQRTRMVGPYLEGSAAGDQQRWDAFIAPDMPFCRKAWACSCCFAESASCSAAGRQGASRS